MIVTDDRITIICERMIIMNIRQENEKDFTKIYTLIKTAFETAEVSEGSEQDFADNLRQSAQYIPELALVAEQDGDIIGHIMLTRYSYKQNDQEKLVLLLAPLAVKIEYRNQGIGSKLITRSFEIACELGYTSIVLAGNPAYYSRFGFRPSIEYNISNTNGFPEENIMFKELTPGALAGGEGKISF